MTRRVRRAELFKVALPLTRPFETSTHSKSSVTHVLIRLESETGIVGYGEVASEAAPFYGPETAATCWHILSEFLLPALLGLEWDTPKEVEERLAIYQGNHFAKAGVDIACWDIFAQEEGLALAQALGGTRRQIESGVSLGIVPTIDELRHEATRLADAGYRRLKLKVRPGMAEDYVRGVREVLPETPLMVDANASFVVGDVGELMRLDAYRLLMIEQPFSRSSLLGHKRLKAKLTTPICLDESIPSVGHVELALELDCCSIINVKVSRLGGLTQAVAVHDLCAAAGIPIWCGGMHEFGIGRAANIALSSLPGFALPGDVSSADERYKRDLVWPPIRAEHGLIDVPAQPGLGFSVDEELIRSLAVQTHVAEACAGVDD